MRIAIFAAVACLIGASANAAPAPEQNGGPPQPHLYHIWTDAAGDTHLDEIKLTNIARKPIPGTTMNFTGLGIGTRVPRLHNAPARRFAVTVVGQIDVEASNGQKAHLNVGDISFLEDTSGKGHKTMEEGAASVFINVPDNFDIKAWVRGQ